MKQILLIFYLLSTGMLWSQRDTREILNVENVNSIQIHTDEVFKIQINSGKSEGIRIKTHSEGEYYDEIALKTDIYNDQLIITTEYPKILSGGYDKLSAHKVFSLEIILEVPENMEISVNSNLASLITEGSFKSISANLKQGYCQLLNFTGTANINTYNGNILVETWSGIVESNSRHGTIEIPEFLPGRNPIKLTTIDGNILVRKN